MARARHGFEWTTRPCRVAAHLIVMVERCAWRSVTRGRAGGDASPAAVGSQWGDGLHRRLNCTTNIDTVFLAQTAAAMLAQVTASADAPYAGVRRPALAWLPCASCKLMLDSFKFGGSQSRADRVPQLVSALRHKRRSYRSWTAGLTLGDDHFNAIPHYRPLDAACFAGQVELNAAHLNLSRQSPAIAHRSPPRSGRESLDRSQLGHRRAGHQQCQSPARPS